MCLRVAAGAHNRGNLGLDCLPEKMALVQKTLIQSCNLVRYG